METGEALERIAALLDDIDHAARTSLDPAAQLTLCSRARMVTGRLEALSALLLAEADRTAAAPLTEGLPSSLWLANTHRLAGGEARRAVRAARDLAQHPTVREAALTGAVTVPQANAIVKSLGRLPDLDDRERADAEAFLVTAAAERTAGELARMTEDVLHEVRPQEAEDAHAARLEREAVRARQDRFVVFSDDGASVILWASLPRTEAAPLVAFIEAHAEAARRQALEARDPEARKLTIGQRRADALIALGTSAGGDESGGRARVIVTMTLADLMSRTGVARPLDGESLSPGETRRLLCDSGVIPVVLGGPSEVLDVGGEQRLVTPPLRYALTLRDRGCVFPDCDVPAHRCEAHHIVPWAVRRWTALQNLALLCPHHHGTVEPTPGRAGPQPERWEMRMAADGLPELLPPVSVDAERRPRRHRRMLGRPRDG